MNQTIANDILFPEIERLLNEGHTVKMTPQGSSMLPFIRGGELFQHLKNEKIESFENFLFIGPHPDDIEFGCGGLISKLKELNTKVTYVIMTDGGAGTNDPSITPEMMKEIEATNKKAQIIKERRKMNMS
mgnify:CR=1 FL=1